MVTDKELYQHVLDTLRWEPSIREDDIAVAVNDGVVTLNGTVATYPEKYLAVRAIEKIPGVRAIADDVKVKLAGGVTRTDTELAHAIVDALHWNIQVPDERVKARVENGWVTLEGDVDRFYQSTAAERTVRYLAGVRGVTNEIHIKPPEASPYEVSRKIKDALRRNAELDADRIMVEAHEGRVTLKGTVRSFAERRDAESAAWAAPGVKAVADEITVGI